MKSQRFLFRLSLISNIVLIFWILRQRATILDFVNSTKNAIAGLENASSTVDEINQVVGELQQNTRDIHLRTIASNDQLDAFLAERGRYVK
jgi:hypothetical protein